MSYCGTCGCFYWPECPRRPDGGCHPAPNPHDEKHVAALAAITVAGAELAGMQVSNRYLEAHGCPPQHTQADFERVAVRMLDAIK